MQLTASTSAFRPDFLKGLSMRDRMIAGELADDLAAQIVKGYSDQIVSADAGDTIIYSLTLEIEQERKDD